MISCISQEQNLFLNFETSFCQFPTWLLPDLRKMLTSTISPTSGVTVMVRPAIFEHFCGKCLLIVWQILLPIMFGIMSPVRCCKLVVSGVVVTTVGMADVIAMW